VLSPKELALTNGAANGAASASATVTDVTKAPAEPVAEERPEA
jgi:cell division protease FtsH